MDGKRGRLSIASIDILWELLDGQSKVVASAAVKVPGVLPGPVFQEVGLAVSPDKHWLLYGKDVVEGSPMMLVEGLR